MNTTTNTTTANIAAIVNGADTAEIAGFILAECCYSSILFAHAVVEAMLSGKVTHPNVSLLENQHNVTCELITRINCLKESDRTLSHQESRLFSGIAFLMDWWSNALEIESVSKSTREYEEYALAHYEQYGELP